MRLQDFTLVEKYFKDTGISPNWLYALANGETEFFQDSCLLNYYLVHDTLIINSGSLDNQKFPLSLLRRLHQLISAHNRVILSSSVTSIGDYMLARYNMRYDSQQQVYIKE